MEGISAEFENETRGEASQVPSVQSSTAFARPISVSALSYFSSLNAHFLYRTVMESYPWFVSTAEIKFMRERDRRSYALELQLKEIVLRSLSAHLR